MAKRKKVILFIILSIAILAILLFSTVVINGKHYISFFPYVSTICVANNEDAANARKMPFIKNIYIAGGYVTDITFLKNKKNLQYLSIDTNHI